MTVHALTAHDDGSLSGSVPLSGPVTLAIEVPGGSVEVAAAWTAVEQVAPRERLLGAVAVVQEQVN